MAQVTVIVAVLVLAIAGAVQYGLHTGHVASASSLVRVVPYGVHRVVDYFQHGNEAPPKPTIPPTVQEWYTARPTDVIITPPAKSGTTWLLHMAHQLRVGGVDPEYDDQMDVTPWLESADWIGDMSHHVKGDQVAEPRLFKSHLPWRELPKDAKLVVALREVGQCVSSMYKFWNPMVDQMEWTTLDQWATKCLLNGEVHEQVADMLEWWDHRNDPNVKLFFFDDMIKDHEGVISELAEFMGVDASEELKAKVKEQSTKAWMSSKEWRHLFNEHRVAKRIREYRGLPPKDQSALTGKVAASKRIPLPAEHRAAVNKIWKTLAAPYGFETFQDMRAAWHKERAARSE